MNPWFKVVFLAILFIVTLSISAGLGVALASQFCGVSLDEIQNAGSAGGMAQLGGCVLRWLNSSSQLFGFLGASLLFVIFMGAKSVDCFWLRVPAPAIWLIPLLTLVSLPLIQASFEVNQWLIPEGSMIEDLVKPREDNAEDMLEAMLGGGGIERLLLNLLIVAVLPAVCEEYVFRGTLQPLLAKATGNVHVAIWATGFLFSFIHFQFYGFLPRLLLGVYFGYLVIHLGSLWPAILAHFLNNAWGVTAYFYSTQRDEFDLTQLEAQSTTLVPLLIAAALFSLLYWVILQHSRWTSTKKVYLHIMPDPSSAGAPPAQDPEGSSL